MSRQFTRDFYQELAEGNIAKHTSWLTYGRNTTIAATSTEDVNDDGIPIYVPDTAQAMELVSDDANDDAAGTGARTIRVYTLDSDWAIAYQDIETDGTTAVNLTGTHYRFLTMFVLTAGSGATTAGNISLRVQGGGTTALKIIDGANTSRACSFTIPVGYTGYFSQGYVSLANKKTGYSSFNLQARLFGGVWQEKGNTSLANTGSTWFEHKYTVPISLPEKTDIKLSAYASVADTDVTGSFELTLKEN